MQAAQAALDAFYVDDGLMGADSVEVAIGLQTQLQELFELGGFVLRKWKSSESAVLEHIPSQMLDVDSSQEVTPSSEFTKVLGTEWNATLDSFRPMIFAFLPEKTLTKRALASDIARLFDVLGWCSPTVIKPKMLLQRLWEDRLDWDEPVSRVTLEAWKRWRDELPILRDHVIPRHYFHDFRRCWERGVFFF